MFHLIHGKIKKVAVDTGSVIILEGNAITGFSALVIVTPYIRAAMNLC